MLSSYWKRVHLNFVFFFFPIPYLVIDGHSEFPLGLFEDFTHFL